MRGAHFLQPIFPLVLWPELPLFANDSLSCWHISYREGPAWLSKLEKCFFALVVRVERERKVCVKNGAKQQINLVFKNHTGNGSRLGPMNLWPTDFFLVGARTKPSHGGAVEGALKMTLSKLLTPRDAKTRDLLDRLNEECTLGPATSSWPRPDLVSRGLFSLLRESLEIISCLVATQPMQPLIKTKGDAKRRQLTENGYVYDKTWVSLSK